MSEHWGVLGRQGRNSDGHDHADGRYLHSCVQILQHQNTCPPRPSRPERTGSFTSTPLLGARKRRESGHRLGSELRGAHERGSRRPSRLRRFAHRQNHPRAPPPRQEEAGHRVPHSRLQRPSRLHRSRRRLRRSRLRAQHRDRRASQRSFPVSPSR